MKHIIIGTAGHIDHGKTALVQALTGVNTDRLKEEKERGLTIDLGFAHWENWATIIDVPGHEKFVRNMVAGVSTIDLVLLVVAADDGVMPQTREHLDILKILQVRNGLIVVTKIDLVDKDWLSLVCDDIRQLTRGTFLQEAEIFEVSAIAKTGVAQLGKRIKEIAAQLSRQQDSGIFWMPVDRSFSMKGFGTVLTGSVLSGRAEVGQHIEILPQGIPTRIRGLQRQGGTVDHVVAGDRAAVNLQGVAKEAVSRGSVVSTPNYFVGSRRFHAKLSLLESAPRPVKQRTRVRLHFGTNEVMARIAIFGKNKIEAGADGYVQFNLEQPGTARRLDTFVIRQYSPTITIGGGIILDANAPKRKLSDPTVLTDLENLGKQEPAAVLESILLAAGFALVAIEQLASEIAANVETVENLLTKLSSQDNIISLKKSGKNAVAHQRRFQELCDHTLETFAYFHQRHPSKSGLRKAELQRHINVTFDAELMDVVLRKLKEDKKLKEEMGHLSLVDHRITLGSRLESLRKQVNDLFMARGFTTPSEQETADIFHVTRDDIREVISVMVSLGDLVRAEENIYFHSKKVEQAKKLLIAFLKQHEEISITQFKDLIGGASRKYAMPLINIFDKLGITERQNDVRILSEK